MMARAPLDIDFAGRRLAAPRLAMLLGGALLLAALAVLAQTLAENAAQRRLLAVRRAVASQSAALPGPSRSSPAQLAQAQFLGQTMRSLSTPWAELLGMLEATPLRVALLAVEPSVVNRSLAITAEAASDEDMLAYLQLLQGDRRISSAVLSSHQVQAQAPGTPIRFQIQAHWGEAR